MRSCDKYKEEENELCRQQKKKLYNSESNGENGVQTNQVTFVDALGRVR